MEFRSGEIEKQLAPLKLTKEKKNETENTKIQPEIIGLSQETRD